MTTTKKDDEENAKTTGREREKRYYEYEKLAHDTDETP